MRRTFLLGLFLVTACGGPEQRQSEDLRTYDIAESPAQAPESAPPPPPPVVASRDAGVAAEQAGGPNIDVTAAPGVAFNYRYAFRLPNARIAPAQEAHATMCERLGIARCRITGMRYSVVNERDVSASLELKLDPAIARSFGKEAAKLVADAGGMLVDQQISGVDAGSSIERANRSRAQLQDELDRLDRELARPGLSSAVRDRLLSEAAALRSQMRALGEQREADEESLARTPMVFHYGSGRTIPGFDEPQPLKDAFEQAGYNFLSALGFLVVAIATLLPWLVLILLGFWLARRFGLLRWSSGASYRDAEPAAADTGELREPAP